MIGLVLTEWSSGEDDELTPALPTLDGLRTFRDVAASPQPGEVCIAVDASYDWFVAAEAAGLEVTL